MHGWTDPSDPEHHRRWPEPPVDEPAWLTDRPAPRSAYLFGDEPDSEADQDPGGEPWRRSATEPWRDEATRMLPADLATRRAARPHETPVAVRSETSVGRHRARRRGRWLAASGAAAAAILTVSVGVGALALPGRDAPGTDPLAADDTVAAPTVPSEESVPTDPLLALTPSASPSAAGPSPTPSRTARPTPKPSRTTAASRDGQRRTTPATPRTTTPPAADVSAQALEVVELVNAERAKAGCAPLTINDKLMTAAQRHSQDQADHQRMSHDGSDGSDVGERLDRVGYAWRAYGENVAWNQRTPAAVMDAWMNSPGHRANILNCSFTEIGVGVATSNGPYWTQDFGTPR